MDKNEKITEQCLKEMFKRVGEKYPNKELTNKKDWYTLRSWTTKEEDSFKKWMKKKLKKSWSYMGATKIDREIGMFLLMWGWTNSDWKKESELAKM